MATGRTVIAAEAAIQETLGLGQAAIEKKDGQEHKSRCPFALREIEGERTVVLMEPFW